MRVLITGAKGRLGQNFQDLFKSKEINYLATGLEVDITNLEKMRSFIRKNPIDVIINCAAYNAVDIAESDWKTAYLVNGIGPRNLALVANEINAIFIHYSTDYVFDGKKGEPYTILDNPNPISRYGESKLLGEKYVAQIAKKYFLIRTSWLFGKRHTNFVKSVLEWSKRKPKIEIVDDQISSPSYTPDIAKITYDLLQTEAYGLYHITNLKYCSRYEWAKYVLNKVGWNGELSKAKSKDFNTPAERPKFSALDNFGIKETVGYILSEWKEATDRFLQELEVLK